MADPTADEPRPERCETCRFFVRCSSTDEYAGPGGYCRRYPPGVLRHVDDWSDPGAWSGPAVTFDDWCGEWQPAKGKLPDLPDFTAWLDSFPSDHSLGGVGRRISNCLMSEGIGGWEDLLAKSSADLLEINNFGQSCIGFLRGELLKLGLRLRGE